MTSQYELNEFINIFSDKKNVINDILIENNLFSENNNIIVPHIIPNLNSSDIDAEYIKHMLGDNSAKIWPCTYRFIYSALIYKYTSQIELFNIFISLIKFFLRSEPDIVNNKQHLLKKLAQIYHDEHALIYFGEFDILFDTFQNLLDEIGI